MIRGETETRITLCDDYNSVEMTWTFSTSSREDFIRDASKMWDWFMNDPIPGIDSPPVQVEETQEAETEDG